MEKETEVLIKKNVVRDIQLALWKAKDKGLNIDIQTLKDIDKIIEKVEASYE